MSKCIAKIVCNGETIRFWSEHRGSRWHLVREDSKSKQILESFDSAEELYNYAVPEVSTYFGEGTLVLEFSHHFAKLLWRYNES